MRFEKKNLPDKSTMAHFSLDLFDLKTGKSNFLTKEGILSEKGWNGTQTMFRLKGRRKVVFYRTKVLLDKTSF